MKRTAKIVETNYPYIGLFLLLAGAAAFFFLLPFSIGGDGKVRFEFMDALVHQHRILPMRYSIVGPLVSLPLWWIADFLKDSIAVISRYNFILLICALLVLYRWLKDHYDRKFLLSFGLILFFGSMIPAHLTTYYGEVFSAVCLMLGTVGLVTKKTGWGWAFLILAVLNTPALLVPFTLVVLYQTWESRQVRYLLLIPLCMVLMLGESTLRTGSILAGFQTYLVQDHGYQTALPYSGKAGYSYPFILGVLSILFSFGKGILFYCPGLLLGVWAWKSISDPTERKLLTLWGLIVLGLILAYSSWWSWYGGWYWGPRFFLFACVPASWILAKAIHAKDRSIPLILALSVLLTLSLWVGVDGVVFQQDTMDICYANNYALESLCWYVPEFSALIRPFISRMALQPNDRLLLLLYGALELYLLLPVVMDLLRKFKMLLHANRSRLNRSTWKF